MADVQEMAREAGILIPSLLGGERLRAVTLGDLERFAELVRAGEREACAKACDRLVTALDHGGKEYRREATASQCAAAIREGK